MSGVPMREIADGVEELIRGIAAVHRKWAQQNQTDSGVLEYSVSYCTFAILQKTYKLDGVVDAEGKEFLDQLVASTSLTLAPLTEEIATKAMA